MRGVEGLAFGVDAAQLRDHQGRAVLPGDQLKGLLRQAMRDLIRAEVRAAAGLEEADLFGALVKEQSLAHTDTRGHIVVSDLKADCSPTGEIIPRVAIDAETGSAKSGHLLMAESVAAVGAEVTFSGELVLFVEETEADAVVNGLRAALKLVPAIGALKSVGFGRVVRSKIATIGRPQSLLPPLATQRQGHRFAWSFGFDRPLLVAAERVEANVLEGAEVIPGSVLKGALARRLTLAGINISQDEWSTLLSETHIGHAFPHRDGLEHGRAMPLSIVTDRAGTRLRDELLRDEASLFDDGAVPLFAPDWKGSAARETLRKLLGIGSGLRQIVRVRTAIDETSGAADEGSLFSYRMTDPGHVRWRTVVDTTQLTRVEFQKLLQVLEVLEDGLDGIGKTDAAMIEAALDPAPAPGPVEAVAGHHDRFALMLETPALLIDLPALENEKTLLDAFVDYFARASKNKLRLIRFFARQSWAGGIVAAKRNPYRPFVLVDPGACFLVEGQPEPLEEWRRTGLPLPEWAKAEGLGWGACRYLPENGFGEISINRAAPIWGTT
jgi:CRISPR/Cas system CSM-associated protein Csm3 (group 7 of RAMP superfamily)